MQNNISWWQPIFEWVKENTIVFGSIALGWKALDKAFKYLSDGRDTQIRAIIKDELNARVDPQITKLSDSIDELKEAIWSLKKP